jgi:uncharacterized lipoprotein YddW (UPF0748 family)
MSPRGGEEVGSRAVAGTLEAEGVGGEVDEVRALWVVRFSLTTPESVRSLVREAEAAGINALIVQVRGRADAFYASPLEPRAEALSGAPDFDPLALVIEEAHRVGIAVHGWVNTHLVWGPARPPQSGRHLVNANPEWLAVPRDLSRELARVEPFHPIYLTRLIEYAQARPQTVEGVYSSPSHPAVQDRVRAVWVDLASRYRVDGLHFDYIRYPSEAYDYSVGGLERFRGWLRSRIPVERFAALDAAYVSDLHAFVDGEPELWGSFQRAQITDLVRDVYRDVKAIRPDLVVSAAVIADQAEAEGRRFQEWANWLEEGILDVAVPMAYTDDPQRFSALVREARGAVPEPSRVWAGIGVYLNTAEGTTSMIELARAQGVGGIALFSYDWMVGEGRGDPSDPLLRQVGRTLGR